MRSDPREQRLADGARGGDRESFEQLYQLYYAPVYALAYSVMRDGAAAEEILRGTFYTAWTDVRRLPPGEPFGRWVQRIAFVQCDTGLRRRGSAAGLRVSGAEALLADADPETFQMPRAYAETPELQARLERVVSRLPDTRRCALTLYYNNGLSLGDTAAVMGLRPEQARSELAYARREIVRSLREAERAEGRELPWGNASETTPYRNAAQVPLLSGMIAGGVAGLILDQTLAASAGSAAGGAAAGAAVSSVAGTAAVSTVSGTAAASTVSGAAVSSVAGTAVTSAAATAGVSAATKIVIGVTAAAVVVGGGYGVTQVVKNHTPDPSNAIVESLPDELLVRAKHYSPSPSFLYCIDEYDYDENCLVIGIDRTYYNPYEEVEDESQKQPDGSMTCAFRYDDAGRILSVTETGDEKHDPGGVKAEYSYDADGNLIHYWSMDHDDPVTLDYTYENGKLVHLTASIERTPGSVIATETSGSWICEDNGNEIIMTGDDGASPDFVERYDDAGRMTEGFDFWYYTPVRYEYIDYPGLHTRRAHLSYTIERDDTGDEVYEINPLDYYFTDAFGRVFYTFGVANETIINGQPDIAVTELKLDEEGHLFSTFWGYADAAYTEFYYAKTDDVLGGMTQPTEEPIQTSTPAPEPVDTGWKQAYQDYLNALRAEQPEWYDKNYSVRLIYLNDDEIPEMVVHSGVHAGGGELCTYYQGQVVSEHISAAWGAEYLERENLLLSVYGISGYSCDEVYSIRDGRIELVAKGESDPSPDDPGNPDANTFTWNGTPVSKAEYDAELAKVYDSSRSKGTGGEGAVSGAEAFDYIERF